MYQDSEKTTFWDLIFRALFHHHLATASIHVQAGSPLAKLQQFPVSLPVNSFPKSFRFQKSYPHTLSTSLYHCNLSEFPFQTRQAHPYLSKSLGGPDIFKLAIPYFFIVMVKLMKQFDQCPFFNPGYIRAGNSKFFRYFALRFLFLSAQSKPCPNHFLFAIIQNVDVVINIAPLYFQLHFIDYFISLGPQYIY